MNPQVRRAHIEHPMMSAHRPMAGGECWMWPSFSWFIISFDKSWFIAYFNSMSQPAVKKEVCHSQMMLSWATSFPLFFLGSKYLLWVQSLGDPSSLIWSKFCPHLQIVNEIYNGIVHCNAKVASWLTRSSLLQSLVILSGKTDKFFNYGFEGNAPNSPRNAKHPRPEAVL